MLVFSSTVVAILALLGLLIGVPMLFKYGVRALTWPVRALAAWRDARALARAEVRRREAEADAAEQRALNEQLREVPLPPGLVLRRMAERVQEIEARLPHSRREEARDYIRSIVMSAVNNRPDVTEYVKARGVEAALLSAGVRPDIAKKIAEMAPL